MTQYLYSALNMANFSHVFQETDLLTVASRHLSAEIKNEDQYDPCRDYQAVTPQRAHKWTLEQKIILWILKDRYEMKCSDVRSIFLDLFRMELSSPRGPSKEAMHSMFYSLRRDGFEPTGSWRMIEQKLESKASEKQIKFSKKPDETQAQSIGGLRNPFADVETDNDSDWTILGDDDGILHTPSKRSTNMPRNGVLHVPACTPKSSTKKPRRKSRHLDIPLLGFRTFTTESQGTNSPNGFVAGLFMNQTIPSSPPPSSFDYRSEATRHVAREHTGPTPFISISSSLIRCMHIASRNPSASQISVIDLHKAGSIGIFKNSSDEIQRINWLQSLDLDTGHVYHGGTEMLIWGEIKKSAIISTISFAGLLAAMLPASDSPDPFRLEVIQTARNTRSIHINLSSARLSQTRSTGVAIGLLANNFELPARHLHAFTGMVVSQWKFTGKDWSSNESFLEGVQEGFATDQKFSSASLDSPFEDFIKSLREFIDLGRPLEQPSSVSLAAYEQDGYRRSREETRQAITADYPLIEDRIYDLQQAKTEMDPSGRRSILDIPQDQEFVNIELACGSGVVKQEKGTMSGRLGSGWSEVGKFGPWLLRLYSCDTGNSIANDLEKKTDYS